MKTRSCKAKLQVGEIEKLKGTAEGGARAGVKSLTLWTFLLHLKN